jgi:hypothetical protein
MAKMRYLNFDLSLERTEQGVRASVLESPGGQAAADIVLPPELAADDAAILALWTGLANLAAAKAFGTRLFEAVFRDEVRACLRSSRDEADERGAGLRLRMRLTSTPDLAGLPWECLYYAERNLFFTLSNKTPLVRFLDLAEPTKPLRVKPPLRMLVIVASPQDATPLDAEREWNNLCEALAPLQQADLLVLERLNDATLDALQWRLQQQNYHMLHFIGHGDFDEETQEGVLLLEDQQRHALRVSCQALGTLLNDHRTLRLVVLNTCKGGSCARWQPFAGTAQCLVQQGVPSVIAMQFEITDSAASIFARGLYQALASGYPIDAALAEARKAIYLHDQSAGWSMPVLYLRAPDGRIFNVATNAFQRVLTTVAQASTRLITVATEMSTSPRKARSINRQDAKAAKSKP